MSEVVVVSAIRTAMGSPAGALAPLGAAGLGEVAVRAAVAGAGLAAEAVDAVIFADEIGVTAGGATPGGGLRALMRATERLADGDAGILVAAARTGGPAADPAAALAAVEAIATRHDLTRIELESFALTSRLRAAAAARADRFADEIAPATAGSVAVGRDETIHQPDDPDVLPAPRAARPEAAAEVLAPAAIGAAALVLTRADVARRRGLPVLARLTAAAAVPGPFGTPQAPIVEAARAAAATAGRRLDDIDLVEVDEISAAHALITWRDLGVDLARLNVLGGALGLGGPTGVSDLRMVVTLAHELGRRGLRTGLAAGDDDGIGRAFCLERL